MPPPSNPLIKVPLIPWSIKQAYGINYRHCLHVSSFFAKGIIPHFIFLLWPNRSTLLWKVKLELGKVCQKRRVMGKRKSSKPPPVRITLNIPSKTVVFHSSSASSPNDLQKKQQPKLDTSFNCPFCNSSKSVVCSLDHEKQLGTIRCIQCQANFQSRISHLTEAIEWVAMHAWLAGLCAHMKIVKQSKSDLFSSSCSVYHDWIDECEKANGWMQPFYVIRTFS